MTLISYPADPFGLVYFVLHCRLFWFHENISYNHVDS